MYMQILSGKHTYFMKHTERAAKMTDMPGSFGFTLLICQAAKQSMVELNNYFLLEFTILLLHFVFLITIRN